MEVPRRGGPYRCLLLFPRVSSTGTVSCLYPLNHPSLLSFVNLGAEDKIIYVPDVRSHQLIHQFYCEALIRSMRFYRVAIGLIGFISSAGLPHFWIDQLAYEEKWFRWFSLLLWSPLRVNAEDFIFFWQMILAYPPQCVLAHSCSPHNHIIDAAKGPHPNLSLKLH